MYVWYQIFIFVAIIYGTCANGTHPVTSGSANESTNCDCDVLQINSPISWFGNQTFTKQNYIRNGKRIYFSTQRSMISWNNHYWSYDKYNVHSEMFESVQNYSTRFFSFERMCKILNGSIKGKISLRWILSTAVYLGQCNQLYSKLFSAYHNQNSWRVVIN